MKKIFILFYFILCFLTLCVCAYAKVESVAEDDVLRPVQPVDETNPKIIKVAVVLPLKGNNMGSGQRLQQAIHLIRQKLNDPKSDFGRFYKFKTIIYDDECHPKKAKEVANKIIARQDIHFVIGHYCSAATLEAAKLYKDNGIIQISPFSTATNLTEQGFEHFFRLAGRNDYQAIIAADLLTDLSRNRNLAVIGYEGYGQELASHVRNRLKGAGKSLALCIDVKNNPDNPKRIQYQGYNNVYDYDDTIDYEKIVDNLLRKKITVVYHEASDKDLAKIKDVIKKLTTQIRAKLEQDILFVSVDSLQKMTLHSLREQIRSRNIAVMDYKKYGKDLSGYFKKFFKNTNKLVSLYIHIDNKSVAKIKSISSNPLEIKEKNNLKNDFCTKSVDNLSDTSQKVKYIDYMDDDNQYINYEKIVESLIQKNVTLVYYGGYYTDLVKILKIVKRREKEIIRELGKKILFLTGDSAQNKEFWEQSWVTTPSGKKLYNAAEDVMFTLTKDYTRDISDRELSSIRTEQRKSLEKNNKDIQKLNSELQFRTRSSQDRKRFLRRHFERYGFFADLYAVNLYTSYQIIKSIILDEENNAGLPDSKIIIDGIVKDLPRYRNIQEWVSKISQAMKAKGSNLSGTVVGFETIIGGVNFDDAGNWSNPEYVIYRWVRQKEDRSWLELKKEDKGKFIGQEEGDFIKIFEFLQANHLDSLDD